MVLYFTGTGNSQYVAEVIAEQLGDELISINNYIKNGIAGDFVSGKPYVLVCPTYAWRVPLLVEDWMKTARFDGCKDLYFVLTCGAGTYGAQTYAKRLCEETGMNFRGFKTVVMPENYIAMFNVPDKEKSARIVAAAMRPIKAAVKSIAAGEDMPEKNPPLGMFMSTIVNWFFYKFTISDKGFHLEKPCVSCGKCVELCPLNNVSLVDGKPVWGGNCTHCMACICGCPAECIEYNKASQKRRRYWFGK